MSNQLQRRLILMVLLAVVSGFAIPEQVDPRFPSKKKILQANGSAPVKRWPPARIRQLEVERDRILEQIALLPQHEPEVLADHLGYHSSFEDFGFGENLPPHWLDIKFDWATQLDSIALAPTVVSRNFGEKAYAFPKRFKIEVLRKSDSQVSSENGEWIDVVNWMDEDFPDPGTYPVFFSGINCRVSQVRMTVPQMASDLGLTYYSLGEIYLFNKKKDGHIGANMAVWGDTVKIEASDSFSMLPLWDIRYLHDSVVGFGVPLSEEAVAVEDLMVTFEKGDPCTDHVQIVLDLGQLRKIGRVEIWPAEAPHFVPMPSFGFPGKILAELSVESDFRSVKEFEVLNTGEQIGRDNLLTVICGSYIARYVRLTLGNLREYRGRSILGLGEIMVSQHGETWSINCHVSSKNIPDEQLNQLPRLVDGFCHHRRILPEAEWIKGLAIRRPLDRKLAVLEQNLALSREAWRVFQLRLSVWGSVSLFLALVSGWVLQERKRRCGLHKLKLRITRDLHDEVGSSLGGISLTSEQLEDMAQNSEMRDVLAELSLMAREACASLREVVWMVDQAAIRLPALIQRLVERAERVLRGVELAIETSPDCPDAEVSLTAKRHLIMFFREAVHNCARHANATQVRVTVVVNSQFIQVLISDNGCGFEPSEKREGWGLDSMAKRAEELGGEMELTSRPGEGTSIKLTAPLKILSKDLISAYQTSN